MPDGNAAIAVAGLRVSDLPSPAAELAQALARVQAYFSEMQHRFVSEEVWWHGFARLFMELERQLRDPIALEIAVDRLLTRQGSTAWSIQRLRMAL